MPSLCLRYASAIRIGLGTDLKRNYNGPTTCKERKLERA